MLIEYADITSRLGDPLWWDGFGVPRYDPFRPEMATVYDHEVALYQIRCQCCGESFIVCSTNERFVFDPRSQLQPPWLHYGDPPRHDCVGDTMNCDDIVVLEWWVRDIAHIRGSEWTRLPELDGFRLDDDDA